MDKKINIKRIVSILLIVLGALLISWSLYWNAKIKYIQSSMLKESNIVTNSIKQEPQVEEVHIKREDYQHGMMVISIPKIGTNAAIVNGTDVKDLKNGPGLYDVSSMPNEEGGNVCIAGHRTTYGAWFRKIDKLVAEDDIILEINGLKYIYKVEKVFIVHDRDWSITNKTGYSAVTLSACHPLSSSKQRIVARGKLQEIVKKQ